MAGLSLIYLSAAAASIAGFQLLNFPQGQRMAGQALLQPASGVLAGRRLAQLAAASDAHSAPFGGPLAELGMESHRNSRERVSMMGLMQKNCHQLAYPARLPSGTKPRHFAPSGLRPARNHWRPFRAVIPTSRPLAGLVACRLANAAYQAHCVVIE